jgi:hypothetical protein
MNEADGISGQISEASVKNFLEIEWDEKNPNFRSPHSTSFLVGWDVYEEV